MGVINKTTEKINELLDKIEEAPDKIENGKTPVFVAGTTTTLDPGMSATAEVVLAGTDSNGNPKYKINFGVPKGLDGTGGSGGGVADSVQWANVLNKPGWVNSATKPTYTASEVGALPADTTIPTKTSQLTNDSKFLISSDFKTINGESIVGEGNISLSGSGGISDAPKDGKTYGRNNGTWVETSQMDEAPSDGNAYARKNKGWASVIESTESALLDNYVKSDSYTAIEPTDSINTAIGKLEASVGNVTDSDNVYLLSEKVLDITADSTDEEVLAAFGGSDKMVEFLTEVHINKKHPYICKTTDNIFSGGAYNIPVTFKANSFLYAFFSISFSVPSTTISSGISIRLIYISYSPSSSNIYSFSFNEFFPNGYYLDSSFYSLKSSSSSEDISVAVGGESGLRKLIKAVEDGNNIYISKNEYQLRTQLICNAVQIEDNGNIAIAFYGMGTLLWGNNFSYIVISYNKTSNTFSVEVTNMLS